MPPGAVVRSRFCHPILWSWSLLVGSHFTPETPGFPDTVISAVYYFVLVGLAVVLF